MTAHVRAATQNACRLCTPLGACLAFKGLEGAVPLLHGSQGCATYIRRYMISHYREPVDIASSSFSEETAVFGGGRNLHAALTNVRKQYAPRVIGIASTCLSETIGDDVGMYLADYRREHAGEDLPEMVFVSTPSYNGSHVEGYRDAATAVLGALAEPGEAAGRVNVVPSMMSPADLRHLKAFLAALGVKATVFPDPSDALDGPFWREYQTLPPGGTPLADVRAMGAADVTIELGHTLAQGRSPGRELEERFGIPHVTLDLPVGVAATDRFVETLRRFGGTPLPQELEAERGRLLDAYADAHKYLFGRRVAIYGEPDLIVALAGFACEVGMEPVLCATGSARGSLAERLAETVSLPESCRVLEDADFADIDAAVADSDARMLLGNSKGYKAARAAGVPLVRVGFPVHDRFGAQRIRMLGYSGTLSLLDRIVNAILEERQASSDIGYTYL